MKVVHLLGIGNPLHLDSWLSFFSVCFWRKVGVMLSEVLLDALQLNLVVSGFFDLLKWLHAAPVDVLLNLLDGFAILLLSEDVLFLLHAQRISQVLRALSLLLVQLVILLAKIGPVLGWNFESQVPVRHRTFL
jgi:hypothetical protein